MYSALKQQGQRLYTLARAGIEVPRAPRLVQIHEFVLETSSPLAPVFRVRCSKGTYIRTLVEDLARQLGTLAHVIGLRRLAVEPFGGQPMFSLAEIEAAAGSNPTPSLTALDGLLRPLEAALPHWPELELDGPGAFRVSQGGSVLAGGADQPALPAPGPVRLYAPQRRFLGVGSWVRTAWSFPVA